MKSDNEHQNLQSLIVKSEDADWRMCSTWESVMSGVTLRRVTRIWRTGVISWARTWPLKVSNAIIATENGSHLLANILDVRNKTFYAITKTDKGQNNRRAWRAQNARLRLNVKTRPFFQAPISAGPTRPNFVASCPILALPAPALSLIHI